MKPFVDSNVIVHAMVGGDLGEIAGLWLPGCRATLHSKAEAFSVLTGAYKVPAPVVVKMLEALAHDPDMVEFVPQTDDDYQAALDRAGSSGGIKGGRIYDALHVCTAERLKATAFVTFNAKHFSEITDLRILDPAKDKAPGK